MQRKKNIFKIASVLLIAAFLVFSTIAVMADTADNTYIPNITQIKGNLKINVKKETTVNHQNVLWDNGPWTCDGDGSTKGENTRFGKSWLEVADDFIAGPKNWTVNNGHFEGLCFDGNLQVDSVLVRFFNDMGDLPANNHFYERYSTDFTVIDYYDTCGYYHTVVDVNFDNVVLSPGRYWVQFTPVGCDGDWHYQARTYQHYGADLAHRDGDPTGGYIGGYGSYTWIHFVTGFDMCFKLTGHVGDPPTAPTIDGPTDGKAGVDYTYTFTSTDPDGDDVKYHIDWDDGDSDTTTFSSSGTNVMVKHTWTNQDTYIIRVTAEDTHGLVGPEGTLTATMPRNRAYTDRPFSLFLENLMQRFPLLAKLLQLPMFEKLII